MACTGPTDDRLAIRELVDAYADAVRLRDADAWTMTWAPDGAWVIRGQDLRGREALRAAWLQAMSAYAFVGFTAFPGEVHVDGDRGTARVHTTEWLVPTDGPPRLQLGCYRDRLVKIDARWYFAERRFEILHLHVSHES